MIVRFFFSSFASLTSSRKTCFLPHKQHTIKHRLHLDLKVPLSSETNFQIHRIMKLKLDPTITTKSSHFSSFVSSSSLAQHLQSRDSWNSYDRGSLAARKKTPQYTVMMSASIDETSRWLSAWL